MDKATFNTIRRCLHPDSRLSVSDRVLEKGFDAFMGLEKYVLSAADAPLNFSALPKSMEEWDRMKQRTAAARKAKRASGKGAVLRR
jgi:hypothetical protein